MPESIPNRWKIAAAAVLMQVALGVLYAWSVFRGPLSQAYGWSKTETIAPYRWSTLFFTVAMIVAGLWQDRKGPRIVGTAGGVLLAVGCLLAALIGNTNLGLILSYGVIGGLGVGFAYVTPIATCVKWFPDKRGLVVGLAVMGFGVGPLVFGPLLESLLGKDPAQFTTTIPRTFLVLAGILFLAVCGTAQMYRVPPKGWVPEGWKPPATTGPARTDFAPSELLRTPLFWFMWIAYFIGSGIGLTAIGEAAPLIQEIGGATAAMTTGAAIGVMSIFNGAGRLGWGFFSDRFGRVQALLGMCAIFMVVCGVLLRNAASFWPVLVGLCFVGLCYGGFLAVMPSLTADSFGSRNIGVNYGLVFTAWGLAGFIAPLYSSSVLDHAKQAGAVAAGYREMFSTLAVAAIIGAVAAFLCRRR